MSANEAASKRKSRTPLEGKMILLFEDDDLVRRATERMLQRLGARVIVGDSSQEAIEKLGVAETTPSWIIADYWFSRDENGLAAANAVREALGCDLRCLIITGDTSAEVAESVKNAGFILLRKPINIDGFVSVLEEDG